MAVDSDDARYPLRLGLFGGSLDTGNLGVSALGISSICGLEDSGFPLELTLFDYGRGTREQTLEIRGRRIAVRLEGCHYSRRFYRTSNLAQIHLAARLGLSSLHPYLKRLRELDGILDISGGDSFSDLYGRRRFRTTLLPKLVALQLGVPLVLLPQTLGPYRTPAARGAASRVLRRARQVWTRDGESLALARALLGPHFDPGSCREGVDVAFGLPADEPAPSLRDPVLAELERGELLLGLNVSGLIMGMEGREQEIFGFRFPYADLVSRLLRRLLTHREARIMLVPHVLPPAGESDVEVCERVREQLEPDARARVFVAPTSPDPRHMKWLIGRCDWFCGTRMHACIAALSQGVPTLAIAYSDKARGVFGCLDMADQVVDPRLLTMGEVEARVTRAIETRTETQERVRSRLGPVRDRLNDQFRSILEALSKERRAEPAR